MPQNSNELSMDDSKGGPFVLGVNYWPTQTGVYGWRMFDKARLAEHVLRIGETGLSCVRVFLLWEDFQPRPKKIITSCLDHLVKTAELAEQAGELTDEQVRVRHGHLAERQQELERMTRELQEMAGQQEGPETP